MSCQAKCSFQRRQHALVDAQERLPAAQRSALSDAAGTKYSLDRYVSNPPDRDQPASSLFHACSTAALDGNYPGPGMLTAWLFARSTPCRPPGFHPPGLPRALQAPAQSPSLVMLPAEIPSPALRTIKVYPWQSNPD